MKILKPTDQDEWNGYLARLHKSDLYFLPEYHEACEANGDGQALAFVASEGAQLLYYPFLMRPIDTIGKFPVKGVWNDLSTAYGYTGPLSSPEADPSFLARAWSDFSGWCNANRVVSEFVRFNPLLNNHKIEIPQMKISLDRETVLLPLNLTSQQLWESYSSVQRNMVRKAQTRGLVALETDVATHLPIFKRLYEATMLRLNSDDYYLFKEAYYQSLLAGLDDKLRLFVVFKDQQAVAAALFFLHQDVMHYHLAGTDLVWRDAAPNNLLLHTAAEWGRTHGIRCLHLGGGRTPQAKDDLLRFKGSLSKHRLSFYTGRRVHEPTVYQELCQEWMRQSALDERPPFFQLYRLNSPPKSAGKDIFKTKTIE